MKNPLDYIDDGEELTIEELAERAGAIRTYIDPDFKSRILHALTNHALDLTNDRKLKKWPQNTS